MILAFFAFLDGIVVAIGVFNLEFGRDLLIYATWTALCLLLVVLATEIIRIISKKICQRMTS